MVYRVTMRVPYLELTTDNVIHHNVIHQSKKNLADEENRKTAKLDKEREYQNDTYE